MVNPSDNRISTAPPTNTPPRRVVSLVPSVTESLFDLGLGPSVVGITDYCIYPPEAAARLPHLGGPKNPRLDEILALQPDLVIANWEENTRQTVDALEAAGVPVWVTFPNTVAESMEMLWMLARLYQSQEAMQRLRTLEMTVDWVVSAASERRPIRYFCPIWFEPAPSGLERPPESDAPWWMTFNRGTYCHDLLALMGGENIFAARERRYPLRADLGQAPAQDPGGRDTRYPRVTLEEILAGEPELVLLPNEPFAFTEEHRQALASDMASTPAVQAGRVFRVDGSLITWHGTRLARALDELPAFFEG